MCGERREAVLSGGGAEAVCGGGERLCVEKERLCVWGAVGGGCGGWGAVCVGERLSWGGQEVVRGEAACGRGQLLTLSPLLLNELDYPFDSY